MKNLVVVESPAKVKTISKFLGKDYEVTASYGHVVDLPKSDLGIDVEKKFKPKYVVSNKKAVANLKEKFSGKKTLIIASDPDREGEAIGWHVAKYLKVINDKGKPVSDVKLQRITFTSITKEAVQEAIKNPRELDRNLFDAQQARRVLDRLVGYTLSPLIWKKIRYGLSAGRVQSVALRLIVDREEERNNFKPDEFWRIFADLKKTKSDKAKYNFITEEDGLGEFQGIKFEFDKEKSKLDKKLDAEKIVDGIKGKNWIVESIEVKESGRYPRPPFTTSTLQQTASNKFGYSAKKTMSVAQKLYEQGLITYMRTDSTSIEPKELNKIRDFIKSKIGEQYLNQSVLNYKTKSKTAQEAHEAIRATNASKTAEDHKLVGEAAKIYELIRTRAIASQMTPAKIENVKVVAKVGDYRFNADGTRVIFDGYLRVYKETLSENILPKLKEGEELYPISITAQQNFTKPPARFTEATLIKMLEKNGIGRPSTYAPTISTIISRKYVEKDQKYLFPTDTGIVVTKLLKKYFEEIVDTGFTAEMEDELDQIADGKMQWVEAIEGFYKPFIKKIKSSDKAIKKDDFTVLGPSPYKCPICGKKMEKKLGRFGAFYSCSDFPKCNGIRDLEGKTPEEKEKKMAKKATSKEFLEQYEPAPKTQDGRDFELKAGRFGEFWAHPDYPKVKEYQPLMMRKETIIQLFGHPPKTKDGREFLFKEGRFGKFWAHPDYPEVKETQRIKENKPKEEQK